MDDLKKLCNKINETGYDAIFRYPEKESTITAIWETGKKGDYLEKMVSDNNLPWLCRFIASEILFKKDISFLYRVANQVLADIYMHAVLDNYTGQMSDWGFRNGAGDTGVLGKRIIIFGNASIQNWEPLLKDNRKINYFDFLDQVYRDSNYRIKDLAALYLIHLKVLPFVLTEEIKERDEIIDRMIAQSGAAPK